MSSQTSQIVKCPSCGANNRVAANAEQQAVCGRCKTPLPAFSETPLHITDANFAAAVESSALPVLIDFWAAWCGPCRMIAPSIDALAKEFAGRAVVGKLNVDENQQTAARFGVQSIPTLLIVKNGREVERLVGSQPKDVIARKLQAHLSGSN